MSFFDGTVPAQEVNNVVDLDIEMACTSVDNHDGILETEGKVLEKIFEVILCL